MAKRQYRNELENTNANDKTRDNKKEHLKDVIYQRLDYKKSLKRYIQ